MPENKIYQPHDRLIKYTYYRKESAMRFFQAYLPPALVAVLDWSKLKLRSGALIDPSLSDQHTDVLYEVPFLHQSEMLLLHCLFEHQSSPDSWIGLRLMGYQRGIWQDERKRNPQRTHMSPIHTLVLYSGRERWRTPLSWIEKLAMPSSAAAELVAGQMNFSYQLVDLSQLSADEIRGDVAGRLTLSLMKAAAEDRTLEWLEQAGPLLRMLEQREVVGMFEVLLRYMLAVDTSLTRENLMGTVERLANPELTTKAMSLAERLIAQGEARGIIFGKIQSLQEFLGLTQSSEQELKALSPEQLERLHKELKARLATR